MKTITNNIYYHKSNRELDENGYLTVHNCFLLHDGIMEYSGAELISGYGGEVVIDGVKIDPNKIYKLNISTDELNRAKDSFKLIPIVNNHTFLGIDGENAKDYQEGSVGENLEIINDVDEDGVNKNFLIGTLKFTNPDTIKLIQDGEKEELSTSYSNDLQASDNDDYDFNVVNIVANHIALVNKGRAGSKVRVSNNENNIINKQKEVTMRKTKTNSVTENDVTLREATEVLEEETKYHEKHPVDEDSERAETDNETVDKRKLIDEIGGILKDKIDEELWRTVIKKAEKLAYSGSERSESDNEMKEDKEEKEDKTDNKTCNSIDVLKEQIRKEIKAEIENENKNILKAYNEVKKRIGDFNFLGMNEQDIYRTALRNSNIDLSGKETLGELKAMYKVYNSIADKDEEKVVFSNTPKIKIHDIYK